MPKPPRPRKAAAQAPEPQPAAAPDAPTPMFPEGEPTPTFRLAAAEPPIDLLGANVETWDLDDLYPYDRNTRLHSTEQLDALEAAMRKYGWTIPLLVRPEGGIIAGHARWQVATDRLRLRQGPVIVARGWTEEMIRAYVIWDNRSAEMATWDLPLLKLEVGELSLAGFDLSLVGFDLDSLAALEPPAPVLNTGVSGSLSERFGVPPFSVLSAREGWWQDRKRAWIGLGIRSELGRGEGGEPGGSARPAMDYSAGERGDGAGRAMRKPNAIPGGGKDAVGQG